MVLDAVYNMLCYICGIVMFNFLKTKCNLCGSISILFFGGMLLCDRVKSTSVVFQECSVYIYMVNRRVNIPS